MENNEMALDVMPATAEQTVEKPKKISRAKQQQARLSELAAKKAADLTPDERVELAELREKARRRESAKHLRELKRAAAEGKDRAILTNLKAAGVTTENDAKAMLAVFTTVKSAGIHTADQLRQALDAAKEVSPELFKQ